MTRWTASYTQDILLAVAYIEEDTAGQSLDAFVSDRRTQQLVERNMEIISEAARRLPDDLVAAEDQVSWHAIKAIGNILRHEYQRVRKRGVVASCSQGYSPLKEAVLRIHDRLKAHDASSDKGGQPQN